MVHLAFFDNFTVPSPLPPVQGWVSALKVSPLKQHCMGGGGGGGPSLGKRAAFIIEQGAIMKTKQIFKVYHILLTRIVHLLCPATGPSAVQPSTRNARSITGLNKSAQSHKRWLQRSADHQDHAAEYHTLSSSVTCR